MSKLSWMCTHGECELKREGTTEFCSGHNKMLRDIQRDLNKPVKPHKPLRRVPVQRYSEKQVDIVSKLHEVYEMMDKASREENGGFLHCSAYPNRHDHNSTIDHSHTISQDRCKKLGHPEWIYAAWNIEYASRKAHEEWDNYDPKFLQHFNFDNRMNILEKHDPHDYDRRMEIWAAHNKPTATV